MRIFRRDVLVFAGLAAILLIAVWSAFLVTSGTVEGLLRQDAEAEGEAWARYLAANVKDLGQIVAGAKPSAESIAFFEKAQKGRRRLPLQDLRAGRPAASLLARARRSQSEGGARSPCTIPKPRKRCAPARPWWR